MNLSEFVKAEQQDRNLFWKLQSGDHQNLLDEALSIIEELMPFVLEDYWPNCATPAYKQAVEDAKAVIKPNTQVSVAEHTLHDVVGKS